MDPKMSYKEVPNFQWYYIYYCKVNLFIYLFISSVWCNGDHSGLLSGYIGLCFDHFKGKLFSPGCVDFLIQFTKNYKYMNILNNLYL